MKNTLQAIIKELSVQNSKFGEYRDHNVDPFTQGINVNTTTNYTIGISKELVSDFENKMVDSETLEKRIKIKRAPNAE